MGNNLLTLDEERLQAILALAPMFVTDPAVESDIIDLVEAHKKLTRALDSLKDMYKSLFSAGRMENSIESDYLKVAVSESGARFKIGDQSQIDPQFLKLSLETKQVEAYVKQNEKLPAGVVENTDRSLMVRIALKGVSDE